MVVQIYDPNLEQTLRNRIVELESKLDKAESALLEAEAKLLDDDLHDMEDIILDRYEARGLTLRPVKSSSARCRGCQNGLELGELILHVRGNREDSIICFECCLFAERMIRKERKKDNE